MKLYAGIIAIIIIIAAISCAGENKNTTTVTAEDPVKGSEGKKISDTINAPRLVEQDGNGALLLTAESGKAAGPDIKYMPEWRAFGWFTAADSVIWDVKVKSSGNFEVHLEWSVSDEEAGKEFILYAGGDQLTGTVDKSGSWETFKTKNIGQVELQEGPQKIVFKSKTKFDKGALLDLRQIKLVKM